MSTSNESETTNIVYEVYEGPDQRRRSRRLQGFPPSQDPLPTSNASHTNMTQQRPSLITPQVNMPAPRHPSNLNQLPVLAAQLQPPQAPPHIMAQPAQSHPLPPPPPRPPAEDPRFQLQLPPPPPVAEIQLVHGASNGSQQAGRPPRRLEFDNQDDAASNHSSLTCQGALGNVQPSFIDGQTAVRRTYV